MGLRTTIKRKALEVVFDAITEMFYHHVRNNPGCRLCEASAAVLPGNYGKQSRLFASHVMDDLVKSERITKYKMDGKRYPQFAVDHHAANQAIDHELSRLHGVVL